MLESVSAGMSCCGAGLLILNNFNLPLDSYYLSCSYRCVPGILFMATMEVVARLWNPACLPFLAHRSRLAALAARGPAGRFSKKQLASAKKAHAAVPIPPSFSIGDTALSPQKRPFSAKPPDFAPKPSVSTRFHHETRHLEQKRPRNVL